MFFGILDLQNIAKTYILQCKIVFFDFQEAPKKKHVVLEVFFGGCQKKYVIQRVVFWEAEAG